MKILLISNTYWNLFNFRKKLINNLNKSNSIFLLANKDKFISGFAKNISKKTINLKNNNISFFKDIFFFIKYFELLKKIKPDVILSFTIKPNLTSIILSRILNIPAVITISGLGTLFLRYKLFFKIYLIIFKFFAHKKLIIFFHNNDDLNIYKKNQIIKKVFLSKVISGSGVDFKRFKKISINFKNNNFLFVGRLIKDKGVNELIEAIENIHRKNRKINFNLVGNFDVNNPRSIDRNKILKMQKKNLLKYKQHSKNIMKEYEKSYCLILPSYREGLSKALIEAMYCGLPIITTNVPGCQDVVRKSKCGYIADSKNSNSLTNQIQKFINLSVSKKKVMSTNSHNYAKIKFNDENVINEYLNAIKKIT